MMRPELDFVATTLGRIPSGGFSADRVAAELSGTDLERASRFRREDDRSRFVLGRMLVKHLLEVHLGHRVATLELVLTEHGRPYLPDMPNVHFSISHAGEFVVAALATETQVGIDIECLDREVDLEPLAERIFNEADLARFRALPQDERHEAFFRAWTRKEAILKAKGVGLFGGVREISVPLGRDAENVQEDEVLWRLELGPCTLGYTCAVAWRHTSKIRYLNRGSR